MTHDDRVALLTEWYRRISEYDAEADEFMDMMGNAPDSCNLLIAGDKLKDSYTDLVRGLVGDTEKDEAGYSWMTWFHERERTGEDISYGLSGEIDSEIQTIEDLAYVIEQTMEVKE